MSICCRGANRLGRKQPGKELEQLLLTPMKATDVAAHIKYMSFIATVTGLYNDAKSVIYTLYICHVYMPYTLYSSRNPLS